MNKCLSIFLILIALGLATISSAQSQTYTIRTKGTLSSKGIDSVMVYLRDSLITRTNSMGYSQFRAEVGDTTTFVHPKYEPWAIVLPNQAVFSVFLNLKSEYLDFSNGIGYFFIQLQRSIKYPKGAIQRRLQRTIYAKIKVLPDGSSEVILSEDKKDKIFNQAITQAFSSLEGKWSSDYSGKVITLPIHFYLQGKEPPPLDPTIISKGDYTLPAIRLVGYSVTKKTLIQKY